MPGNIQNRKILTSDDTEFNIINILARISCVLAKTPRDTQAVFILFTKLQILTKIDMQFLSDEQKAEWKEINEGLY